jgi:hypothetical protein
MATDILKQREYVQDDPVILTEKYAWEERKDNIDQ